MPESNKDEPDKTNRDAGRSWPLSCPFVRKYTDPQITVKTTNREYANAALETFDQFYELRQHVRSLTIKDDSITVWAGRYWQPSSSIDLYVEQDDTAEYAERTMVHELSHAEQAEWPIAKIEAWMWDMGNMPPLTDYTEWHKSTKPNPGVERIYTRAQKLIRMAKEGNPIVGSNEFKEIKRYLNTWQIKLGDFANGRLDTLSTKFYLLNHQQYATEQYAALMEVVRGHLTKNHRIKAVKRAQALYETKYID